LLQISLAECAVARLCPQRDPKQFLSFIKADRLHIDSRLCGQFSDFHSIILNPILRYKVNFLPALRPRRLYSARSIEAGSIRTA
jgi:hypothetical protein